MSEGVIRAIDGNRLHILEYEKKGFQDKVLQTVPLKRLKDAALKSGNSKGLTFHEHFMKEVNSSKFFNIRV